MWFHPLVRVANGPSAALQYSRRIIGARNTVACYAHVNLV